jgi:hypothetical protein
VNPNVLEEHVVSIFRAEVTKLGSRGIRVWGRHFEGRRIIRDIKCEKKVSGPTERPQAGYTEGGLGKE